jgi:hypothetical protein
MMYDETQEIARSMFGDQLYQQRAQIALPLLVRQAWLQNTILYQELADELEMPKARNLNFVLGSVGTTLLELGQEWGEIIPPIQSLVVNQGTGQPGTGFFGGKDAYQKLSKRQREAFLQKQRADIYGYPKWDEVLKALELPLPESDIDGLLEKAANFHAGGESEAHKRLKLAIAEDPTLIGLPASCQCVGVEHRLPSGDSLDLLLKHRRTEYAIEVKPASSPREDIVRGMFQCVKYRAVLVSWRAFKQVDVDCEVILVLGGELPADLLPLKNALQIRVKHLIVPSS